jgi:predicted nucleic acid-binding Zn ribbon protein
MARRHRHCVVCGKPLPKRCSPQRKYCDGACKAAAYRDRCKARFIFGTAMYAYDLRDAGNFLESAPYFCAHCGALLLPGIRRRADASYCSGKCRTRAWRAREAVRAELAAVTASRHPDGPETAL